MALGLDTTLAIGQHHLNICHHALIFMVKDMTMEYIFADVALIAGSRMNRDTRREHNGIFPGSFHAGILRVSRIIDVDFCIGRIVDDVDNLKRVDMDVERVLRF